MTSSEFLAGYFDADGTVGINKGCGTSYFLLTVRVSSVDPNPLRAFKEKYGGAIVGPKTRSASCRPIWFWTANSEIAEHFLLDVAAHLIVKRERALLALEFRDLYRGEFILPRGRARNPEKAARVMSLRQDAYDRMAKLNHRGALTHV